MEEVNMEARFLSERLVICYQNIRRHTQEIHSDKKRHISCVLLGEGAAASDAICA
jgi:galactokinase/mevalonate kinase-like predicted kinase